jgi:hypothetical protein
MATLFPVKVSQSILIAPDETESISLSRGSRQRRGLHWLECQIVVDILIQVEEY